MGWGCAFGSIARPLARKGRPRLPAVAHRAVRERLLLAFAPLRKSATSENQLRLLDEEASAERGPGQGGHQAPEEVRLAMRGHLGVPGEASRQIGQDSSPPVRFRRAQTPPLEIESVDRKHANPGSRDAQAAQKPRRKLGWRCVRIWECETKDAKKLAGIFCRKVAAKTARGN